MKKIISPLIFIALFVFSSNSNAQVAVYTFGQSTGAYAPIVGTLIDSSTSIATGATSLDDVNYLAQALPFTFTFNGLSYTSYTLNSNGYITFGATAPANNGYVPISAATAYSGAASGLGRDIQGIYGFSADRTLGSAVLTNVTGFSGVVVGKVIGGTGITVGTRVVSFNVGAGTITMNANATSTGTAGTVNVASGELRSTTTGVIGSRIHTVQWTNFKKFSGLLDYYNFQIKLYESTNKVELVYGTVTNGPVVGQFQVGLRGGSNADFNNRKIVTATPDWTATIAGTLNTDTCRLSAVVAPPSGLTFTYTPGVVTNDVGVSQNLAPIGNIPQGSAPITPSVKVKNYGANNQFTPFPVVYKITGPANYQDSTTTTVATGGEVTVNFPSTFNPAVAGTYNVTAYTELSTDVFRGNDTLKTTFNVIAPPPPNFGSDSGYFFANSLATTQPSYPRWGWKDTTESRNLVLNGLQSAGTTLVGSLDDGYFKLSIKDILLALNQDTTNKHIKFNGNCYDSIFPGTNGIIGMTEQFGAISISDFNVDGALVAKNALLPLWHDVNFATLGTPTNRLSYKIKGSQLIITYDHATSFAPTTDWVSFQVVIEIVTGCGSVNSNFRYTYADTASGRTSLSFLNNYFAGYNATPGSITTFRNFVIGFSGNGAPNVYGGFVSPANPFPATPPTAVNVARPIYNLTTGAGLATEYGPSNANLNSHDVIYLRLSVSLQGLQSNNRVRDTVEVILRDASAAPYKIFQKQKVYLDSVFNGVYRLGRKTIELSLLKRDYPYYLVINHRNSVLSWSQLATTSGDTLSYDFTTNVNKTFGNNAIVVNGAASLYSGDVDSTRDGCVNLTDVIRIFNAATSFTTGPYVITDLNWDGAANLPDIVIASNNNTSFICKQQPPGALSPMGEELGDDPVFNYDKSKINTQTITIPDAYSLTKEQWLFKNKDSK